MLVLEVFDFLTRMSWIAGVCFAAGFILIIVEMFLPGFGAPGTLGAILLFLGILSVSRTFIDALIIILVLLILFAAAFYALYRSGLNGKLSRSVVLHDKLGDESDFRGTEDRSAFLGRLGLSLTDLRPSGVAVFDGTRLDVVTQGEYIEKNAQVKITEVEGSRIVVVKSAE